MTSVHGQFFESLQNVWRCSDVSAGFRHRGRVVYLIYCYLSFVPKVLYMQQLCQEDSVMRLSSVAVAGASGLCTLVASIVGWYSRDKVLEANVYVLEDPGASRRALKLVGYATLICYLYPALIFGQAQMVAESGVIIVGCYYLLWVPLMDASRDLDCCVLLWLILACFRLAHGHVQFSAPMAYCLKVYAVEGSIIRCLLRCGNKDLKQVQATLGSDISKQQFIEAFSRPSSAQRWTSQEAFQRIVPRLQSQEGCVCALDLAMEIRRSWARRRSITRGQPFSRPSRLPMDFGATLPDDVH